MTARFARQMAAVVVVAGMLVACTATDDRQADAGDPAGVPGGWSAESLPALAGVAGSGPVVPLLEGVTLDGSLGLSTSTVPVLAMAEPPAGATSFAWSVTDLGGQESVFATSTSGPSVRVAEGALVDGRVYLWSVVATGPGVQPVSAGPFVFNVDTQREGRQPAIPAAGVTVAAVSGEPVWSWQGPSLATATGSLSWGLSYRPTGAASDGLPSSWRLQVAGSNWDRLEVFAGGVVGLRNRIGSTVTFSEQSEGSYEAVWGPGQSWPSGQFSTLVRNDDGTWVVTDLNRVVTTFSATTDTTTVATPTAVWTADSAELRLEYTDGQLTALADQVSGRSVEMVYGGGDCPARGGDGFTDVPNGQLCAVKGWDGSVTALRYVDAGDGAQLGRVTAYSGTGETAQATDLAYDAAGRLAAVRSPLAGAVVASGAVDGLGAQDPRALTQITYDDDGRVATVTAPAALTTGGVGPDPARDQRASWTVNYESPGVTSLVRNGFDTPAGFITRVEANPATMLVSTSTNAAGATETTEWNVALASPTTFIADNGLVSRTTYDPAGLPVEQRGPAAPGLIDGDGAPVMQTAYDRTFADNPDGVPLTGLGVTYWRGEQFSGTPAAADTGPSFDDTVPESLLFNWPASPTGSPGWSARLSGRVAVATDGGYQFTAGGTARLWVNGLLCDPTCDQELKVGEYPLRVDVATADDVTGINVQWTQPGGIAEPIPTAVLRPAYNLTASETVGDALNLAEPVEVTSTATYDDPANRRIVAMASSSGLSGSRTYEAFDPEAGDWARPTGYADPSGAVSAVEYWGNDEGASPSCDGGQQANQAGMPRTVTQPGGALARSFTYDAAGRVVAWTQADTPTICFTYDATGRPLTANYPSVDGAPAVSVVYDYAAGNNPLVATTSSTTGDTTTSTRVVVDLLGRPVQSTDPWGSTTDTTYDPSSGAVATSVTRTTGGQSAISTFDYNPDGTLASTSADGATLATYAYDPSGRITQVILGEGTVGSLTYDSLGYLDSLTWASPDGTVRSTAEVFASSGRLLRRSITGPDGPGTYDFGYDLNGRLTSAALDTSLEVTARNWAYEFDGAEGAAANRTAQVVDGRRITYSYDDQHRLTATDDPTLAGGITYDSRGNTTQLGPLTMTYAATGALATATDGTTTVTNLTSGTATTGQQVTGPDGTAEVRFSASGLQLDADNRVVGRSVSLAPGVTVTTTVNEPTTWALPDLRGNTTWELAASSGSPTTLYDPFGQVITASPAAGATPTAATEGTPTAASGSTPTAATDARPVAADARPVFGWHGASGVNTLPLKVSLMEMGARTYVPALGRFLESDPVVNGGANPYAYVNGDPVNGHDVTGTSDSWFSAIIGAAVAIVVGAVIGVATAGAGLGPVAVFFVGLGAAALGGALGEVTSELIDTGTVNFATVGWAALVDTALAAATFGAGRFFKGRSLAKAAAGRSGSVAGNAERSVLGDGAGGRLSRRSDTIELLDPQFVQLGDPFDAAIINPRLGRIGEELHIRISQELNGSFEGDVIKLFRGLDGR